MYLAKLGITKCEAWFKVWTTLLKLIFVFCLFFIFIFKIDNIFFIWSIKYASVYRCRIHIQFLNFFEVPVLLGHIFHQKKPENYNYDWNTLRQVILGSSEQKGG